MLSDHTLRMAEKQAACLKNFYAAGVEMLTIGKNDKVRRIEIAAKHGLAPKRLSKARQCARQYSPAEFDVVCTLRKPDGLPLQVGHLDSLLTLPWKTESARGERAAIQKEAAAKGWTAPELAAEIKTRFPKPRRQPPSGKKVGRPRKSKRIDLAAREARALLRDLMCQIQNSTGVDERHVTDLLELQSEAQAFATMAIYAVSRAA